MTRTLPFTLCLLTATIATQSVRADCSRSSTPQNDGTAASFYVRAPVYTVQSGQQYYVPASASMAIMVPQGYQFALPDQSNAGFSIDAIVTLIKAITDIATKVGGGSPGDDGGKSPGNIQKQLDDIKMIITSEQSERKKLADSLSTIQQQVDQLKTELGALKSRVDALPNAAPAGGTPGGAPKPGAGT